MEKLILIVTLFISDEIPNNGKLGVYEVWNKTSHALRVDYFVPKKHTDVILPFSGAYFPSNTTPVLYKKNINRKTILICNDTLVNCPCKITKIK